MLYAAVDPTVLVAIIGGVSGLAVAVAVPLLNRRATRSANAITEVAGQIKIANDALDVVRKSADELRVELDRRTHDLDQVRGELEQTRAEAGRLHGENERLTKDLEEERVIVTALSRQIDLLKGDST